MYTVHFEKCKRLYQSNGFHEKIIFKSMFTPTHTQVHKHTRARAHTHTLLKNRKIIAKEKITLLKSEVGIYECQLESQKCNHRCVLPEEDSIHLCKKMPLVGRHFKTKNILSAPVMARCPGVSQRNLLKSHSVLH